MKKIILSAIIFLIVMQFAYAIGLETPTHREIVFEPDKRITFDYAVGNSDPQPLEVDVVIEAGELQKYVIKPEMSLTVPPFETVPFVVDIALPSDLAPGLYPVKTQASQHAIIKGMGAISGVADIINIISQFPEGYPYTQVLTSEYQKTNAPLRFQIKIQNIGKTALTNLLPQVKLTQNGMILKQTSTWTIPYLKQLGKGQTEGTLDVKDIVPGIYSLETELNNVHISQPIAIGEPDITVSGVPKVTAAQHNEFDITLNLDSWTTKIENAKFRFSISGILSTEQQVTLQPGLNTVHISGDASPGKGGTYKGSFSVRGDYIRVQGDFQTEVEGSAEESGGMGFVKTGKQESNTAGRAAELSEPSTSLPKSNTFLIILLIVSFAVFSFALGQYMARNKRGGKDEVPITPP